MGTEDLEAKEESLDKDMNLYEGVEDAVEESYADEEDAVEESYEDSQASYGQSDESYGDEEESYEDYEGFYDDQEELFGADQDDMYSDKDTSESQMRVSESEVRSKIAKKKDDFQESKAGSKDKYKHLDVSDENISEKSSMGGGFHPDNLNAVHSKDIQRKKGLEDGNEEKAKWSSADESVGVESNWGADKEIKDNADQEMFLGKYTQEPEENGEFLAAVPADTPTFNLKSKDRPVLTADFSSKALHSSGVGVGSNASSGIHIFLFSVLLARLLA